MADDDPDEVPEDEWTPPPGIRQCKAQSHQNGRRCRGFAMRGLDVCRMHGGQLPMVKRKAARRVAEEKALKLLEPIRDPDAPPIEDPIGELQKLAGEVVAWKNLLRYWVSTLTVEQVRYSAESGEQIHAAVVLFERAQDRAARLLTDLAKLDLGGRVVKLQEQQVELVYLAMRAFAEGMGYSWLDDDVRELAALSVERVAINAG